MEVEGGCRCLPPSVSVGRGEAFYPDERVSRETRAPRLNLQGQT